MKVTIICDVLGEANNGTTLAAKNLINYLKSSGHEVTVVSPDNSGEEGYISVEPLNLGIVCNWILHMNGVLPGKPDKAVLRNAICDADVVHLLLPFPLSITAVKIAKELGKPVTASFHCQAENITAHLGLMNSEALNRKIYKTFYNLVYQYCDAVHYPSELIREIFEEQAECKTNAYVISNGVNDVFVPDCGHRKNEKFTIICSGRYSREKAQQQLLEAVALSKYKNDIRIILAGDGPRSRFLQRRAKKLNLDVDFHFFSRSEMVKALQSADLYVHTAIVEIEAIACMEAICCGLVPVICNSQRSATRFFAVGENTLYTPDDYAELASKIDYWYEHGDEKNELSKSFESIRKSFSQKDCMRRMEEMLVQTYNRYNGIQ